MLEDQTVKIDSSTHLRSFLCVLLSIVFLLPLFDSLNPFNIILVLHIVVFSSSVSWNESPWKCCCSLVKWLGARPCWRGSWSRVGVLKGSTTSGAGGGGGGAAIGGWVMRRDKLMKTRHSIFLVLESHFNYIQNIFYIHSHPLQWYQHNNI